MPDRTALGPELVYRYDGSLQGLLCCVFECYTRRERVLHLEREEENRLSLYPTRTVVTDAANARRVQRSLPAKLGAEGAQLATTAAMCSDPDTGTVVFRFICMGYRHGPAVCGMLHHDTVIRLHRLYRSVWNEQHHYLGFVRFFECTLPLGAAGESTELALPKTKGALAAIIEPKHHILPLIAEHFCNRYPEEQFLIYDKTRHLALVYRPYQAELTELEQFELPEGLADQQLYETLWKGYYTAVATPARYNPKLRQQHLPKRFWPQITELQGQTGSPTQPMLPQELPEQW